MEVTDDMMEAANEKRGEAMAAMSEGWFAVVLGDDLVAQWQGSLRTSSC